MGGAWVSSVVLATPFPLALVHQWRTCIGRRCCVITLALATLGYKYVPIYQDPLGSRPCVLHFVGLRRRHLPARAPFNGFAAQSRALSAASRPSNDACIAVHAAEELGDLLGGARRRRRQLWLVFSAVATVSSTSTRWACRSSSSMFRSARSRGSFKGSLALSRSSILLSCVPSLSTNNNNPNTVQYIPIAIAGANSTSSSARATWRSEAAETSNGQDRTPVGIAVLIAFFFGAMGTRMGVAQVSYIGKIGVLFRAFSSYPFYVSPDAIHLQRARALPRAQVYR
ncbi:hypothetical protein B0H16DRAFT_1898570 [Mycena metata]|uniref:Uncharacterized protein n=1 Tax=Mycena metata TaxID=1033252 RepID=A0AAD7H9S0_9AGAR|nr:hypothetical protein B0H16DRAFT_1898570 [Mycena metata]